MVERISKQNRQNNPDFVRMTREGNHMGLINWAQLIEGKNLALLELPGPENPKPTIRDGKIATDIIIPLKEKLARDPSSLTLDDIQDLQTGIERTNEGMLRSEAFNPQNTRRLPSSAALSRYSTPLAPYL